MKRRSRNGAKKGAGHLFEASLERNGPSQRYPAGLGTREPATENPPCRILVTDDHPLLRAILRAVLESEPDLEVVGEARDGREAVESCLALDPDLVLMDIAMPSMDGIEATREIKARSPGTIVMMVTAFENPEYLLEAVRAGAAGYVLKHATKQHLLGAVRGVLNGESSLDQGLAMQLLKRLAQEVDRSPPEPRREAPAGHPLTARELEVLRLLALGNTNRQIADELTISRATVKTHVERLIRKLGVSDRTQAAVGAVELGLVEPGRA